MNRLLRTLVWCALVAFVGQLLVAPAIAIFGVAPDFTVIALLTLALGEGALLGCAGGFLLGLVQDLAIPHLLGLSALCKTLVGYGGGRARDHLQLSMPLVQAAVVVLAALLHDTLYLAVESGFGGAAFFGSFVRHALPAALYSGLVGVPLLLLAARAGVLGRDD